jgi:hypothetical protein
MGSEIILSETRLRAYRDGTFFRILSKRLRKEPEAINFANQRGLFFFGQSKELIFQTFGRLLQDKGLSQTITMTQHILPGHGKTACLQRRYGTTEKLFVKRAQLFHSGFSHLSMPSLQTMAAQKMIT